jgi:hypothetical protein
MNVRTIYGHTKEEESWRIRTNQEIGLITKGRYYEIYKTTYIRMVWTYGMDEYLKNARKNRDCPNGGKRKTTEKKG